MGLQVAIDLWVHGVADHVVLQAESAVPVVPQLAALADQGGLWLQSAAWGRVQAPD